MTINELNALYSKWQSLPKDYPCRNEVVSLIADHRKMMLKLNKEQSGIRDKKDPSSYDLSFWLEAAGLLTHELSFCSDNRNIMIFDQCGVRAEINRIYVDPMSTQTKELLMIRFSGDSPILARWDSICCRDHVFITSSIPSMIAHTIRFFAVALDYPDYDIDAAMAMVMNRVHYLDVDTNAIVSICGIVKDWRNARKLN